MKKKKTKKESNTIEKEKRILTEEEKKAKRIERKKKERIRFFRKTGIIIGAILIVYFFVVGIIPQHGNQMFPAIKDGDLVLTFRLTQSYETTAVVAYKDPNGQKRIGRLVGMPGDTVDITEEGRLVLNGLVASEEIFYPTTRGGDEIGQLPVTVPENCYFILNDHRSELDDSRSYGLISKDQMMGQAFWMFRRRSF